MEKKRLTKYVWWGSDVDKDGNPILPDAASAENHLDGLNVGEVFIHVTSGSATLWTATPDGKVVPLSGADIDKLHEMFLSKQKDDKTEHSLSIGKDLKVGGNLGSTNFVQGNTMGSGWSIYRNANGNTVIETDNIVVRQSLKVNELVVNQETFSKGSTIYVKGGCTITEVEEFDEFYRCYYDNEGGARFSGFKIDDQARCQRYDQSYENVIKYYWRLVVGVGDDYVDLSKTDADGEGVPEVGDDIAQFGHRTDKTRQSAVILSPDNGGSVSILAGIDSFNVSQKDMVGMGVNPNTGRAYLYGYGDMYFGDRNLDGNFITYQIKDGETEPTLTINADVQLGGKSTGLSNLSEFKQVQTDVNNLKVLPGKLEDIQKQIDGQIESYFEKYNPTVENEPASLWTTDELKAAHLNDTFTNLDSGYSWRWTMDNEVYGWTEIADTATVKALLAAGQAQDTADGKRRVFVNTPFPPYDEGDLWVQGSSGDILRCSTPKGKDESYEESDWVKASKYTDDTALNDFINGDYKKQLEKVNQQIDERAETWYQEEDPSLAWDTEELKQLHVGDLWYDKTREQSFMWTGSEWITQGVPDEVFDTIDGKSSIYVSQPDSYKKNDLWFLSEDTTLDADYKAGTIVIATETSDVFVAGHWTKRDNYTDDTRAEEAYQEAMKVKVKSESFQKELEGLGVDMEIIKQQTDREFTIWYGEEEPTLKNEPAKDWVTEADKNMHDQDLYYSDNLGKAWRFVNGEWIPITDERTIAALNKAQEAYDKAAEAEREAKDLTYLKLAFGDGDKENAFVGGIVMSKVVGVINDNKEVESFLNGSDFAKDDTHGKLILAGGIPSVNSDGETQLDERAKESATRLYEDGHVVSKSADIEGTIRVGTMVYKTLYGAGGDLTGYSMAVGTQGGTFSFLLPQITDEDFIEVKVVWFGLSRLATTYYVMAKDGREINYKSGGEFVSTTELNIKGDTFYKFFSVRGKWYVSTENILSL